MRHIKNKDSIHLEIDSDVDGFTSFAIFMNYFNNLFPSIVQNNITYNTHDGKYHGIEIDKIPKDTKLLIMLDASSNEYEIHKQLAESGIDVLVIDHHQADKVSEYACIINNQLCDYPTKSLSGAGMVYKFCTYFDSLLNTHYADDYLDLVALGLVADMVDIRDFETKELMQLGFNRIKNPFIQMMMDKNEYSIKGELTPMTIGFYIAPYINAVARIGTLEETRLIVESMLEFRALEQIPSTKRGCKGQFESRVEQACRTAANVRNRQNRSRDASAERIAEIIEERNLLNNKILVVLIPKDEQLNTNITGLIANQISSKYQHPTLILNERYHNEELWWEGSARGVSNSKLNAFRSFLLSTGLMEYCEGHEEAFGVGIKDNNVSKLIETTNKMLINIDFSPSYKVDFIFDIKDFYGDYIKSIAEFNKLWGQQFERPKIAIENVPIENDNFKVLKGATFKFSSNNIDYINFKTSEEDLERFEKNARTYINIVGECEINNWNGKEYPQLIIKDYEITEEMSVCF